jgi:ketopantoate hydroxymethyltransferase
MRKIKIPKSFIAAAYAGACAAHQVSVHEDMFGQDKIDFHEHFTKNFQHVKGTCSDIVGELQSSLTLKEIASNSPANYDYGGF